MFSIFVENLKLILRGRIDCVISLPDICLILLLFADDMVIVSVYILLVYNIMNNFKIKHLIRLYYKLHIEYFVLITVV